MDQKKDENARKKPNCKGTPDFDCWVAPVAKTTVKISTQYAGGYLARADYRIPYCFQVAIDSSAEIFRAIPAENNYSE